MRSEGGTTPNVIRCVGHQKAALFGSVLGEDSLGEFCQYMLPSFIYFVNNNCMFFIAEMRGAR